MATPKRLSEILKDIEIVKLAAINDNSRAEIYKKMQMRYEAQAKELTEALASKKTKK